MKAKDFSPDKFVLLLIDAYGGKIRGKTLLQKRAYFISTLMNKELDYRAHYFGPYSPEVDEGIMFNKSLGFVQEQTLGFGAHDTIGFEIRRYDYCITEDGKEIIKSLKKHYPSETNLIQRFKTQLTEAGDNKDDYISLSIAAKTFFIAKRNKAPITVQEIQNEASRLGWDISPESIKKAIDFLVNLKLATRN